MNNKLTMSVILTVQRRLKASGWLLGLLSLAVVVALWVLSSFLVNEIFEKDLYSKPFFITYINTSIFIFYLVPLGLRVLKRKLSGHPIDLRRMISGMDSNVHVESSSRTNLESTRLIDGEEAPKSNDQSKLLDSLSLEETIRLSFQFCMLWYMANLATNASLKYTSVSSQTILSSTSSFFTLFLGYLFQIDRINRLKIISLLFSLVGIVIVTKIDADSIPKVPPPPSSFEIANLAVRVFFGNFLALLGAFFYGAYTVLLKLKVKNESRLNTKLFFGFVGIFNLILLWPTLIIWHVAGVEKLELPSSGLVWRIILLNCLITFISDYCWAVAVLLTTPLTVTVGLSLTIPLALLGDAIYKGKTITVGYLVGAVIIGVSFLLINKDEEQEEGLSISNDTDLSNGEPLVGSSRAVSLV